MPYQGGTIVDWAALGLPFQSQGEKAIGVLGEQVGSLKIPDCQGTVVDTCFPPSVDDSSPLCLLSYYLCPQC